jgi:branched-chain amino acid transport system ATP-binding protein
MSPADVVLRVAGLSKYFGGLAAVKDVSFEVKQGEIMSMIGPNGAGKTTAFNCITGVYPFNEGHIELYGEKISNIKPWDMANKGVCRTFQITKLFAKKTVLENLVMAQHITNALPIWDVVLSVRKTRKIYNRSLEKAHESLEFVGMAPYAKYLVDNLSLGDQKRVELAMALVRDPRLLMLDEPTAGLNPAETYKVTSLIKQINSEKDLTVFFIEHDMKMVMGVSERIVVLNQGRKIAEGLPDEIRNNEEVVLAYLGRKRGGD